MSAAWSELFVVAQLGPDLPGTNVTDAPTHRRPHLSFNTESVQLLTGILLAIAGNLVISISLNVQKHVHNLNDAKPESERRSFTSNPMWWIGLSGTVAGEVGNFLAFGFAGADIVTPLGAVGVVSNAVIACVFLGELFRIRDALGVLLTCLGTVLIVIKAPASERDMSVDLFMTYVFNPIFVCYICAVVVVAVALWLLLPRLQARHPAYGLLLCSLLGTATVLCSTALANFIRVSVNGDQQFASWQPYVLVLIAIPTAIGQVSYLNSTMELFDNTKVVPTYYILFTLSTIIGSAMLYQDFYDKPADAVFVFILGCLLCFAGVALLTSGHVAPDDDDADAQQAATEEPVEAGSTFAAERQTKRISVRTIRQALRHLDSPLFLSRSGRMTSSRSFDDLYEDFNGRGARQCPPHGYMSDFSPPSKVTDAPFGGGEHARVWSLSHTSRRTVSEDGCVPTASVATQRRSDRRPPPLEVRRSHSAQNLRGGIETGLLDQ